MNLFIDNKSGAPIYDQIYTQIKALIISGELNENDPLPSVRALSGQLRISSLTVKKAYDRLEEEGFVVTVHGKGTYVAAADRSLALEARRKAVEDDFAAVVQKAAAVGFTKEDILEILNIILEDY